MPATPVLALPYPAATDPADVPADIQKLADRLETVIAKMPAVSAYKGATQSIPNGAPTAVIWETERYDTDTIHDPAVNPSRLTCKTAGKYLIITHIAWEAFTGGTQRRVFVMLNGTARIADVSLLPAAGSLDVYQSTSVIWAMVVNDYVEVQVYQDSGAARNVAAAQLTVPCDIEMCYLG